MQIKTLLLFLTIFATAAIAQAQKRTNRFPAGTFHERNVNITGISVGLYSGLDDDSTRNVTTNGIRMEAIGLGILSPLIPSSPVVETEDQFRATMAEPYSEKINGFNLSPAGTVCDCLVNGISAGFIGQINRKVTGVSVSLVLNLAQAHNGVQMAMVNQSYAMNGIQIGISNSGGRTRGLQIGLFNHSTNFKGVQIGLWNTNQKRKLPLLNWNFSN